MVTEDLGLSITCRSKPLLVPPFRFAAVTQTVFRGAYPKPRNYPYLQKLKLKTIVSLLSSTPSESFLNFCESNQISNVHLVTSNSKDSIPLTFETVTRLLKVVVQKAAQPVYVHCVDGTVATGVAIMCLRKLQMWDFTSTLMEYARFARDTELSSAEPTQFLEIYQTDMELPPPNQQPVWLKDRLASNGIKRHPTLKVKLVNQSASVGQSQTTSVSSTPVIGNMANSSILSSPTALGNSEGGTDLSGLPLSSQSATIPSTLRFQSPSLISISLVNTNTLAKGVADGQHLPSDDEDIL